MRSPGSLRPFRMGKPEVSRVVGKAQNLSNSFLTSLAVSEMMRSMSTKKNPNAVALGKLGGVARASSLTKAERSAIAKKAAAARNAKLSVAERSQIAKLAVKTREQKRKLSGKEN